MILINFILNLIVFIFISLVIIIDYILIIIFSFQIPSLDDILKDLELEDMKDYFDYKKIIKLLKK